MRLVIQGKELEFRVQERKIVTCSVFHKGEEIAADLAICAPQDNFDPWEGEKLAVTRASEILYERQKQERQDNMVKVDKVFTETGALSGSVEFPSLETPLEIVEKVMVKLDARRSKKALENAKKTVADFRIKRDELLRPLLTGTPFITSPYVPFGRTLFGLPFGISTKPRGF